MTLRRPLRPLVAAALAAGLVVSAPWAAAAADLADPEVTAADGVTTMVLDSATTSENYLPKGGAPTKVFPEGPPSEGDAFAFTEDLTQDGTLVGTDEGACTVLDVEAEKVQCKVAVTLGDGTIAVVGPIAETEKSSTFDLVSGTGAYQGIDGTATVVDLDDKHQTITLKFTTLLSAEGDDEAPVAPKATTKGGTTVLRVHAEPTGAQFTPKGGEPTDEFPDEESYQPRAGDAFSFTEDLTQDDAKVGTTKGTCTNREQDPETISCVATISFPNGTLRAAGIPDENETGSTVPLVAGTGAYSGARGTLAIVDNDDESSDYTLTFSTADGQVATVPTGGAATGGGGSADGTDSALLIGVGLAAVAGAGGLFAAARVTGRRS